MLPFTSKTAWISLQFIIYIQYTNTLTLTVHSLTYKNKTTGWHNSQPCSQLQATKRKYMEQTILPHSTVHAVHTFKDALTTTLHVDIPQNDNSILNRKIQLKIKESVKETVNCENETKWRNHLQTLVKQGYFLLSSISLICLIWNEEHLNISMPV